MERDLFINKLLEYLDEHLLSHPQAQAQDAVKFIFQGMLGVGHLLTSSAKVQEYIESEMVQNTASPDEPLSEQISPAWCRLNLRRAMSEGISAKQIADMMLSAESQTMFTRQDVIELCLKIAPKYNFIEMKAALEPLYNENYIPSHSQLYRDNYRPAYRLIPTEAMKNP